ncbi:MAG: hypothetical protein L6R37_007824 [Teloschistes peruensis]|nr:MAG: hypothetical protein L6R37_007824 [Teloschistes peruensis]
MSYPVTQLGGRPFNHNQSGGAEAEYDRLRDLARQEHGKKSSCMDKAHSAYERGDGAAAHELSEEGKRHGAMMDQYNKQASDFIFRENNSVGRVDSDTIDLHGQFVEEAEDILEQRIKYAQSTGQTHLHVIVGKGNHSYNHIQKIKPRVEQVCQQLGLQYATEHNAGRMYINLQGGAPQMPQHLITDHNAYQEHHPQQQHYGLQQQQYQQYQQPQGSQQQYPGGPQYQQGGYPSGPQQQQQQQHHGGQHQQQQHNQQNEEIEKAVKKYLPRILRKLQRSCCTVM